MRIFDLVGSTDSQRRGHRVALLGTCRLFGPFEELVDRGRAFLAGVVGFDPPGGVYSHIVGIDIIRTGEGGFQGLEDN